MEKAVNTNPEINSKPGTIKRDYKQQSGRQNRKPRVAADGIEKRIVSIRRVTRVYKGGKRMRLSVVVVAGDKNGKVGVGLGKGADVRTAEEKAFNQAKKSMVSINRKGNTITHSVMFKLGAARVMLKPAAPGTGIIAGGAVRAVVEMAGVKDVLSKVIGTNNKNSNVYATLAALQSLKK